MAQLKLKHTLVYTLLGFLPLSFSLLFTPLYTRYLSREEYGLLSLFTMVSGVLLPFFGMGVDQAFGYLYFDHAKDRRQLARLLSTTIVILLCLGLLIFLPGLAMGQTLVSYLLSNSAHFDTWPFLVLSLTYPLFMGLNRVLLGYYRNEENIRQYAVVNAGTLVLITLGSVIGVILLNKGAAGAVEGRTLGFCAIILIYTLYETRHHGLTFDREIGRSLFRMGIPLFASTLVGSVAYMADRLILEQVSTLDILGIYGFSVTVASVAEISLNALANSFIPTIYKSMMTGGREVEENARFQLFFYVYAIIAVVVGLIAVATPLVGWLIAPAFFEAVDYIPLLCISFIPRSFSQILILKFYKTKKTGLVLVMNIVYFVSIVGLGLLLYPFWGLRGLAFAVFATAVINIGVTLIIARKVDPFTFRFGGLYRFATLICASVLALYFIPGLENHRSLYYLFPLGCFVLLSPLFLKSECMQLLRYIRSTYQRLFHSNVQ